MDIILNFSSWFCIVLGVFFGITGALGLHRFPDFYTRIHAASITDTLCAGLIIFGLVLQSSSLIMFVKLFLVLFILTYTGPTAIHTLAKSARKDNLKPVLGHEGEES